MIDDIKTYLVEVGLKKILPMFVIGAMTALGTFLAAHANELQRWGITYGIWPLVWPTGQTPSGPVILLELDTFKAGLLVLAGGLITAVMMWMKHHSVAAITGTPQSGDVRVTPNVRITGGERASDPPKEVK